MKVSRVKGLGRVKGSMGEFIINQCCTGSRHNSWSSPGHSSASSSHTRGSTSSNSNYTTSRTAGPRSGATPTWSSLIRTRRSFRRKRSPRRWWTRARGPSKPGGKLAISSRFDILFENETIEFKEACVFNLETKVKTHNKGFFILTCELLKQSTKLVENPHNPKLLEARKSLRSAWKTTLRISCQHDQINQFYSLVLSDTDYFGTLHLYVGSVWLGHKIRRN